MDLPRLSLPSVKLPGRRGASRRGPDRVVGLEIEPSHLAAAEVLVDGGLSVARGAVAMLEPGTVRDGEPTDPIALVTALRAFFAEHDLPKTVRLGIANGRVVVRTLDLPLVDDPAQLADAVRAQAPDHIPMPIGEAVMDFQSVGTVQTPAGPRSRVVVVAVRRDMVERLREVCAQAGLDLVGIDLSAFALIRAIDADLDAADPGEAVLYATVGGIVNVSVAEGTTCLFTRAAAGGVEGLAQALAERCSLTMDHARQWLRHVGLALPVEDVAGEREIVDAARGLLLEGVAQLADTIRNSLDFYLMQETSLEVHRVVLAGPAIDLPGFAEALSRQLGLPVTPASVAGGGDAGSRLTVAAGLAVESRPAA